MKATQEKLIQKQVSFFRRVECETGLLLKAKPKEAEIAAWELYHAVKKSHDLAWALQVFPLFDPACLNRMVVQEFVEFRPQFGGPNMAPYTGPLCVPAFAQVPYGNYRTEATWRPNSDDIYLCGRRVGSYPRNHLEVNTAALKGNPHFFELKADSPKIPQSVSSRVEPIRGRFEELSLVFEAEWAPSPVKDPLVIGRIGECHFLVDEFDVTKLERYVSSEFTTKAREK